MNKMRPMIMPMMLTMCLFSSNVRIAYGWGCYAHWLVGNPVGLGMRANLPDYWGQSWSYDLWPPYAEIIPLFPWSHGCMRTGWHYEFTPIPVGVPNEPSAYGAAPSIAEQDMYHLVRKMSCAHQQALGASQMIDTARGFLVHNSFDRNGHFAQFPAGTIPKWAQHALLEKYVDFRMVDQPPGILETEGAISIVIGFQGHAGIILLSQKCYRKNRYTIDTEPAYSNLYEPGPVETLQTTTNRIYDQVAGLSPMTYTYDDYETLLTELLFVGWTSSRLNTYWTTEIQPSLAQWSSEATSALETMPQIGPSGCLP